MNPNLWLTFLFSSVIETSIQYKTKITSDSFLGSMKNEININLKMCILFAQLIDVFKARNNRISK